MRIWDKLKLSLVSSCWCIHSFECTTGTYNNCNFGTPRNASFGIDVILLYDNSRSCSWPNPWNGVPCTVSIRLSDKSLCVSCAWKIKHQQMKMDEYLLFSEWMRWTIANSTWRITRIWQTIQKSFGNTAHITNGERFHVILDMNGISMCATYKMRKSLQCDKSGMLFNLFDFNSLSINRRKSGIYKRCSYMTVGLCRMK